MPHAGCVNELRWPEWQPVAVFAVTSQSMHASVILTPYLRPSLPVLGTSWLNLVGWLTKWRFWLWFRSALNICKEVDKIRSEGSHCIPSQIAHDVLVATSKVPRVVDGLGLERHALLSQRLGSAAILPRQATKSIGSRLRL